jgi:FtsH-binding integral membrane protein
MRNPTPSPLHAVSPAAANEVIARFMSRVYGWMTAGIVLTAFVAYNLSTHPEWVIGLVQNQLLFWGLIIVQLGAVIFLTAAIQRIGSGTATLVYMVYAALTGVTLSTIFLAYTQDSIANAFAVTAVGFAGLSAFGYATKRDLGPVGSFCTMGLFGMIGFALIAMFVPALQGGGAQQLYSIIGLVVFAGLTAWDTQKIKALHAWGGEGSEEESKGAIIGALTLYLDFINLFLLLLRLVGRRR